MSDGPRLVNVLGDLPWEKHGIRTNIGSTQLPNILYSLSQPMHIAHTHRSLVETKLIGETLILHLYQTRLAKSGVAER